MKTIVVGDIHGHVASVEEALAHDCNVVFVGDYLDAFHQTVENQVRCLTMVMDAVEGEPDRVVGLLGNHEMSYLDITMQCSGYKYELQVYVDHLKDRMLKLLKDFHWVGKYLVTHAGVDNFMLKDTNRTVDEYLEQGKFNAIGKARGGYDPAGGLYWNDFDREMEPVPGLQQVVGHSNSQGLWLDRGVRVKHTDDGTGATWCVDNLNREREVLMIEDDDAYPYPLQKDGDWNLEPTNQ